jgi:DNA-binding beta-propeller fold protein YncE
MQVNASLGRLGGVTVVAFALAASTAGAARANSTVFPAPAYYVSFPLQGGGELGIVDPATLKILTFVSLSIADGGSRDLLASPTKPLLYIIGGQGAVVDEFNTNTLKIEHTIAMPQGVTATTVSPSGDRLYAYSSFLGPQENYIFEIADHAVAATMTMPSPIGAVTVGNHGRDIFVSMPLLNEIAVIDRKTHQVERTVFLGACIFRTVHNPCEPIDLTTSADGAYVVAACWRNAVILDASTGRVVQKVELPAFGRARVMGVDPYSNTVWLGLTGSWFGMSMAPPFATSVISRPQGYSVAFQAAGQGVGIVREGSNLDLATFTPSGFVEKTKLGSMYAETIVYSP